MVASMWFRGNPPGDPVLPYGPSPVVPSEEALTPAQSSPSPESRHSLCVWAQLLLRFTLY